MPEREDDLKLLGLTGSVSAEEIKQAYRRLAKDLHPDHAGEGSKARFQLVQGAYRRLCDDKYRRAGGAADAFFRDLGVKAAATGAEHARGFIDQTLAKRGRIGRAVASLGNAVLDEADDLVRDLLKGPPK